jgi:hypothetical protein
MAKYGINYYGASTYGATPKLSYSVEPMAITVLSFTKVLIGWQSPTGTFSRIRLVRNQNGFPEHSEDGVIVWEEYATEGTVSRTLLIDGEDNPGSIPITSGKASYYGMFIFTDEKVWVNAGQISDLVPKNHNTQTKFVNLLPRVFTSKEQSPFSEVDTTSALFNFVDGFSFTLEEFLTYVDLLRPTHSRLETSASLLYPETTHLGLTYEPGISTRNQKKLIREAIYMYNRRGTKLALGTYIESLTNFAPNITVSENLLLSVQDSTFYNSTGNWIFESATAEASNEQVPVTGNNVIDTVYTCKVTATDSFYMLLGADAIITKGVPVKADSEYTVSCKIKSPPSDGNIFVSVNWYDGTGTYISVNNGSTVSANNTWKTASVTATAPSNAVYAAPQISSNADGVYYIDQVCMQLGDTVVYDEARAVSMFLNPSKTNFINNPSFENNVTDAWTKTGLVTVTQDTDVSTSAYSGVKSAKLVATGPWSFTATDIPVQSGAYYTVSSYVKTTSGLTITFIGKDEFGAPTGHEEIHNFDAQTGWARITATDLIDAINESNVAYYSVEFSGSTGTFYLDCVQFEQSPTATDYFDGELPVNYGAVWEGTANNSYTRMYYNKDLKMQRLSQTVTDWVPMNSWWRIKSYEGLEYTNLDV